MICVGNLGQHSAGDETDNQSREQRRSRHRVRRERALDAGLALLLSPL